MTSQSRATTSKGRPLLGSMQRHTFHESLDYYSDENDRNIDDDQAHTLYLACNKPFKLKTDK